MSMAGQQSRVSLFVAVKNGNLQDVIDCVESGCSVDVRDGTTAEATALYVACKCNRLDICEFLLQSGADVNAQTKWRSTPLHVASDRGHTGCAFRLLLFGADVNVMNRRGETALHLSAKRGHVMTVELLVGAGAKLHVRDKGGLTPQRAAEVERQDDTVGVLSRVKDTLGYLRKRFQDDKIKLGLVLEKSYSSCQSVLGRGTPRLDLAWKALVQLPVQWQNEIAAVFREQVEDTDLMVMCEERKQRLEPQLWVLGVDYTIKGGAPVGNGVWDRHLKSISLLFEINHNLYGSMMLKVLIGLNQKGNGQRRVKMDTKHRDDIFSTLPSHPHVARVIHRFEAETMAFKCFVPSTVSSQLHRDITLEKFATCLVTDRYPLCLKCIYNFLCEHVKPGEPWSDAVGETFLILVTIQALKGIRHLHMHGISNSRISMENVLVDNQMRVVITDNIQNPQFHHHLQDSCITEDSCIPEDETIKSACTECPDVCTLAETIEALMHPPTDIGEDKVDASSLTHSQEDLRQDEDTLVTETSIECNYSQILTHLLTRMKSDDQSISTDVGNSLIYAGAILFFRDCRKLENKEELRCWTTANLISQTLLSPENSGWTQDGHHLRMQICNVSLEGRKTLDTLRRQFLCETTCDQLWSAYQWVTQPI